MFYQFDYRGRGVSTFVDAPPSRIVDEGRFQILIHRVFVTGRATEFVYDAPVEEFSLIDAKRAAKDPKVVAGQISRAFVDLELRTKEPFLLILKGNRKPILKLIY